MTAQIIPGGPRVPAELVTGINVDLDGDVIVQRATTIDFEGAGVAVTNVSGVARVTISGGAGGSVDTDATLKGDGTSGNLLGINPGHVVVVSDGTTIAGNGATGTPLHVVGSALTGTVPVAVDGTLTGNGTTGSPLHVVSSGATIVADGTTIAGNGAIGTPVHTVAGGTAIAVDGTTIAGTGVTGTPVHTVDGGTGVAVDGTSITGTGKTGSPLVAHVGAVTVHTDSTLTGDGTIPVPLGVAPAIQIELAVACANVAADGTVTSSRGFASIVRTVAGQYTATLNSAPPTGNVVPIVTIDSASGVGIPLAQAIAGGVIHIRTIGATDFSVGTTSDAAFYIAVFRTA